MADEDDLSGLDSDQARQRLLTKLTGDVGKPPMRGGRRRSRAGLRLKCRFNTDIRVVAISASTTFNSLYNRLAHDYGFDVGLKYEDKDGDRITLSSQNDMEEMLEHERGTVTVHVTAAAAKPVARVLMSPTPAASATQLVPLGDAAAPPVAAVPPAALPAARITRHNSLLPIDGAAGVPSPAPAAIRWQRGQKLGAGAFGVVYLGLNLDTGELMAVKQIDNHDISARELAAMEHEIRLVQGMSNENIVRYLGTERTPETLSIFLEYVPGGSIRQLLEKFGQLDETVVRVYTRQILLGLEYLHNSGIAHRDIKGANILVANDGTIKLADFGASKRMGARSTVHTATGMKGTPMWMAPEVIKEQQTARGWKKADVWSVGCTVVEMLTGKPPWSQYSNPVTAMYHIACEGSVPDIPDDVSDGARSFLEVCFQREPADRPDPTALLLHPFVGAIQSAHTRHLPESMFPLRPATANAHEGEAHGRASRASRMWGEFASPVGAPDLAAGFSARLPEAPPRRVPARAASAMPSRMVKVGEAGGGGGQAGAGEDHTRRRRVSSATSHRPRTSSEGDAVGLSIDTVGGGGGGDTRGPEYSVLTARSELSAVTSSTRSPSPEVVPPPAPLPAATPRGRQLTHSTAGFDSLVVVPPAGHPSPRTAARDAGTRYVLPAGRASAPGDEAPPMPSPSPVVAASGRKPGIVLEAPSPDRRPRERVGSASTSRIPKPKEYGPLHRHRKEGPQAAGADSSLDLSAEAPRPRVHSDIDIHTGDDSVPPVAARSFVPTPSTSPNPGGGGDGDGMFSPPKVTRVDASALDRSAFGDDVAVPKSPIGGRRRKGNKPARRRKGSKPTAGPAAHQLVALPKLSVRAEAADSDGSVSMTPIIGPEDLPPNPPPLEGGSLPASPTARKPPRGSHRRRHRDSASRRAAEKRAAPGGSRRASSSDGGSSADRTAAEVVAAAVRETDPPRHAHVTPPRVAVPPSVPATPETPATVSSAGAVEEATGLPDVPQGSPTLGDMFAGEASTASEVDSALGLSPVHSDQDDDDPLLGMDVATGLVGADGEGGDNMERPLMASRGGVSVVSGLGNDDNRRLVLVCVAEAAAHTRAVTCSALTTVPVDGEATLVVVTGGADGRACVHEVATGALVAAMSHVDTGGEESVDGEVGLGVVGAGVTPSRGRGLVVARDASPSPSRLSPLPGMLSPTSASRQEAPVAAPSVSAVAVAQKSPTLVTGCSDACVWVWDVASGGQLRRLAGHAAGVTCVVTVQGSRSARGGRGGRRGTREDLDIGRLGSGRSRAGTDGGEGGKHAPSGDALKALAGLRAVSGSADHSLRVWDLGRRRALVHTLRGHTAEVNAVAVVPGSTNVVSAASDQSVRVWDIVSGRLRHCMNEHFGGVLCVVPVGVPPSSVATFSSAGGGAPSGAASKAAAGDGGSDKTCLLSGARDGAIKLWGPDGKCVRTLRGHRGQVALLVPPGVGGTAPPGAGVGTGALSSTLKPAKLASSVTAPALDDSLIQDGIVVMEDARDSLVPLSAVAAGASSGTPSRGRVMSCGADGIIRLWDYGSGRCLRRFRGHRGHVTCLQWAWPGFAASAGADGVVRVWNVQAGVCVVAVDLGAVSAGGGSPPAAAPMATPTAGAGDDDDGEVSASVIVGTPAPGRLSPDVGDGLVFRTPPALAEKDKPRCGVTQLQWAGDWLVTASKDGVLRVFKWDLAPL